MEPVPDDQEDGPRFGTDEWGRQLNDRHGQPAGRHVRPPEQDEPPKASEYAANGDVSELAEMLHRLQVGRSQESELPPLPPSGVRFDWTFSLGHVFSILAAIGTGVGIYISIHDEINKGVEDRAGLHREVEAIRSDIATVRPRVLAEVEAQAKLNTSQDNRIENLADAIRQSRDAAAAINMAVSKLTESVATMHEDLALLKDRLGRRSNVETPPEHDALIPTSPDHRHP